MKRKFTLWVLGFFIALCPELRAQQFTLSGTVSDSHASETLIGASIHILETNASVLTNEYGFYSVTLPAGTYTLKVSYFGYSDFSEQVELDKNIRKNVSLSVASQQLSEVVVDATTPRANIRKPEMSVNKLTVAEVKKMPVVMGETDILKSILQLPGVTNAGETTMGFNVRGGAADQNLILLDEATIYNSSHFFGFFSVFNTDAIKDLKLYKGGIPARFGGRISSVLDIYQKEGNNKEFHASGGIGAMSSRLLAEGPIVKEKGSYLFAGRASYAHLFLKLTDNKNSAYFYDLNTKLSYSLNDNNKLFLSGYFGRDNFSLGGNNFTNVYGNSVLNLRWNHLFSDKLFTNLSMIYSDYYYGLELDYIGFKWDSGIRNFNLKYDFKHYLSNDFKLFYGANAVYYDFNPGEIEPSGPNSAINPLKLEQKYAFEPAIYLEAEQSIGKRITVNYGLRYSWFWRMGSQTMNVYENGRAVVYNSVFGVYEKADPIGTKRYGKGETIADFGNLEPRIAIAFEINQDASVKASYNRMAQYVHLISNTSSPTPLDVWAPSDDFLKPQQLHQYAVGYFRNFSNDAYSLEAEAFYKTIKNRADYIDGADLIANDAIEQVLLSGKSRAYGLELMFRKNTGRFNGWVSYTLSRSEQQTPGRDASEPGINNGQWYKTGYDKLHNLAVTAAYDWTDKWTFGANFALQSGQPVTYPNGYYEYQGVQIPSYGLRNENRLPAYHHLDVSATYRPTKKPERRWQSEWVFSIYNLYNRMNSASISFRQNEDTGRNEAVRLSIFGIIPSATYNFKF